MSTTSELLPVTEARETIQSMLKDIFQLEDLKLQMSSLQLSALNELKLEKRIKKQTNHKKCITAQNHFSNQEDPNKKQIHSQI
jgi:hypothetical protein